MRTGSGAFAGAGTALAVAFTVTDDLRAIASFLGRGENAVASDFPRPTTLRELNIPIPLTDDATCFPAARTLVVARTTLLDVTQRVGTRLVTNRDDMAVVVIVWERWIDQR
jgi:hypothetical protein